MWPGHISIRGGLRSIVHIEPLGINQLLKSTNWLFAECSYNMFLYEQSSLVFTMWKSSKLVFMLCTQLLHIFVTIVVFFLLINHILKFKVMEISEDNLFMYKKGTAPRTIKVRHWLPVSQRMDFFLNLYTLFISNQASYNVFTEPEVEKWNNI